MAELIPTGVGRLFVMDADEGPVTVFWHSLFVDQRSWGAVLEELGPGRRVILIDAPNHGRSEPVDHDFTIKDCAAAAVDVLDHLGIAEPVDWVGNALGGHVGIVVAATNPDRVRSLVTIGTPVEAFGAMEKWGRLIPLVALYRAFGPKVVDGILTKALLGEDAVAAQPDRAHTVMEAFRRADRSAMLRAMRCLMLRRRSLRTEITRITCPTLFLVAEGGQEGWTIADAQAAASTMSNAAAETLPGTGNVGPLVVAPGRIAERLRTALA